MKIGREIEKAWQIYQSHVSLRGVDSHVSRNNYRMWMSLKGAMERGLREPLNLYLTEQDFEGYCACLDIPTAQARYACAEFAPGITLLPGPHPYSHFYGHDKNGRLKSYAVLDDAYFDPEIDILVTEIEAQVETPLPAPAVAERKAG